MPVIQIMYCRLPALGRSYMDNKKGEKMITTKQMAEDLKKLKKDDFVVCDKCGDDGIVETLWVRVNDVILIKGKTYYRYDSECESNEELKWYCYECADYTKPTHITEYKESE